MGRRLTISQRLFIPSDEFKSLLSHAEGQDKALILVCLNAAMYLQEAVRLRWDEVDFEKGVFISHRRKRGKIVRIAALWKETVEALKAIERKGEYVFIAEHGKPLGIKGAEKRFRKLRAKAGVEHITSSQLAGAV
jgi:integrase